MQKIPTIPNHPPRTKLPAAKRLQIARGVVAQQAPFFGSLLFNHAMVNASDRIQTMAIDGRCIFYHEDYVVGLTAEELHFELCHEVSHVLLGHLWRGKGRIPVIANKAGDLVIDEMLVDAFQENKSFKLPSWCALNRAVTAEGGYTMEGVYNVLLKNTQLCQMLMAGARDGKPIKGRNPDDVICAKAGGEAAAESRTKLLVTQAKLLQDRDGVGSLSLHLDRMIKDLLHPRLPWRVLLRRFMSNLVVSRENRSWARLGRRSYAMGVPTPFYPRTYSLGPVAIGIDCSGSITNEILQVFQPEVRGVVEECRPIRTNIYYFDSEVCGEDVVEAGGQISLKLCGGGGTAFSPVIRAVCKLEEPPEVLIMLTDLQCFDYGPQPPFPVLWVVYKRDPFEAVRPPFGEVIYMEEFNKVTVH